MDTRDFRAGDVARVTALLRNDTGLLGWFDAADDPRASELLREAALWLHEQGATTIVGPMDGDTWHRYRVNAGPFDAPPFLLEPVNPPYWHSLWEAAGFSIAERYTSKRIDDITELLPRIEPVLDRARDNGYRFRPLDPAKLREELGRVYRISLDIFRDNAFYFDIALDDFLRLYDGIERILVPDLFWFAEGPEGDDAGFLFAYHDRAPGVVNYKTIGVSPAHRGSGLSLALQCLGYRAAIQREARTANHCLMREGNRSQSLDAGAGSVFRNYYLYRFDR